MPMQCPNPTKKPVAKKTKYKGSIDDIKDKPHGAYVRNGYGCLPNPFPAWASNNNTVSRIDIFPLRRKENPIGAHFHARHFKVNIRIRFRLFANKSYSEFKVCHGFNRLGADIKDNFSACKCLSATVVVDVAVDPYRMICICGLKWNNIRKDRRKQKPDH